MEQTIESVAHDAVAQLQALFDEIQTCSHLVAGVHQQLDHIEQFYDTSLEAAESRINQLRHDIEAVQDQQQTSNNLLLELVQNVHTRVSTLEQHLDDRMLENQHKAEAATAAAQQQLPPLEALLVTIAQYMTNLHDTINTAQGQSEERTNDTLSNIESARTQVIRSASEIEQTIVQLNSFVSDQIIPEVNQVETQVTETLQRFANELEDVIPQLQTLCETTAGHCLDQVEAKLQESYTMLLNTVQELSTIVLSTEQLMDSTLMQVNQTFDDLEHEEETQQLKVDDILDAVAQILQLCDDANTVCLNLQAANAALSSSP